MDDLLSLMEGGNDDGGIEETSSSDRGNASSSEELVNERSAHQQKHRHNSNNTNNRGDNITKADKQSSRGSKDPNTTIDEHTGMRIVNRRTSRVDLIDTLSPHEFRTTPNLAAMSRRDLESLVTVPSASNNGGFAGGKSNLATIGLLFRNVGTRISSKGSAFSIFQLGDLNTGPVVSVFLFGDAYSRHSRRDSLASREGAVLAILCPNILPPKPGGETSISLSVNDERQIVVVGTAQDYGVCAGKARTKRDGRWIETNCKQYVDLRLCRYCRAHQKQAFQKQKGSTLNGKKPQRNNSSGVNGLAGKGSPTFMQKMRMEHAVDSVYNSGTQKQSKSQALKQSASSAGGVLYCNNSLKAPLNSLSSDTMLTMSTPAGSIVTHVSNQQQQRKQLLSKAPLHMKKNIPTLSTNQINNPYAKAKATKALSSRSSLKRPEPSYERSTKDHLGIAIGGSSSKSPKRTLQSFMEGSQKRIAVQSSSQQLRKKVRKIANDEGFDGHVMVPKPNKLFSRCNNETSVDSGRREQPVKTVNTTSILDKQRQLAGMMKQQNGLTGKVTVDSLKSTKTTKEAFFEEVLDKMDREKILSAKSRFSNEADAELYARKRNVVTELEKKETLKDLREEKKKKNSKGKDGKEAGAITVEWKCLTCRRTSSHRPVLCVKTGHNVRQIRDIKKRVGVAEARLRRQQCSVEEGGMTLGSGLEWSGWRGS